MELVRINPASPFLIPRPYQPYPLHVFPPYEQPFPYQPYPLHVFPPYEQPFPHQQYYRDQYPVPMFQPAATYQNVPREVNSRWTSPGAKRYKLNTDGSSRGNPGPSSYGGLLRMGDEWVCGYMGTINNGKPCTSLEAEVMGIYHGLCVIRDRELVNVMIETDSDAAIRMINGEVEKDQKLTSVFDDIWKLVTQQKCALCHTRRDGNQCADLMAKLGSQYKEFTVLEKPPTVLLPYLQRDTKAAKEFADLNKPK